MPIDKAIITATLGSPLGEAAYKIVETLYDKGYEALWVGGCVREMLQGTVPHDIDIATNATPDEIKGVFPKAFVASAKLGSLRLKRGKAVFELTTFRKESSYTDNRRPDEVEFGTREEDARRRDFTINALYFNPINRELIDSYDGENDVKEKLIRFVEDPRKRIEEDALRILRAVRFRAKIDGQYHPDTYRALQELAEKTKNLSGVRILQELEKMLMLPTPGRALEDLWELRVLEYVLPELHACKGIAQPAEYHHEGDVWDHSLRCVNAAREDDGIDVRLAALFHDAGKAETFSLKERIRFDQHASVSAKIARDVFFRMGMEKKRREKIGWLIEHHMMMGSFKDMPKARKAHWYFHEWFTDLLRLFWLDIAGTTPADFSLYEAILKDYHAFLDSQPRPPKPFLTGEEIMQILDIEPGEEVGKIMEKLHDAQVHKDISTKEEAREFIKKYRP